MKHNVKKWISMVLALVMVLGLALKGVWISVLTTQTAQFLCFALRYKSGKWTEKEI